MSTEAFLGGRRYFYVPSKTKDKTQKKNKKTYKNGLGPSEVAHLIDETTSRRSKNEKKKTTKEKAKIRKTMLTKQEQKYLTSAVEQRRACTCHTAEGVGDDDWDFPASSDVAPFREAADHTNQHTAYSTEKEPNPKGFPQGSSLSSRAKSPSTPNVLAETMT